MEEIHSLKESALEQNTFNGNSDSRRFLESAEEDMKSLKKRFSDLFDSEYETNL